MKKSDWKVVGQWRRVCDDIQTIIIKASKQAQVGIDMLEWLADAGKDKLEEAWASLVEAYKASDEYKKLTATATPPEKSGAVKQVAEPPKELRAEIDLDAKPSLPFEGAIIEKNIGGGKVIIEKRADGHLYIGGKKVILHRVDGQLNGKCIRGHELRTELDGKPVLNGVVYDFLWEHQEFLPEHFKKDSDGNIIYIFFWGTVYRSPARSDLFVRYLYFLDGVWYRRYHWLGNVWNSHDPAALLAS